MIIAGLFILLAFFAACLVLGGLMVYRVIEPSKKLDYLMYAVADIGIGLIIAGIIRGLL